MAYRLNNPPIVEVVCGFFFSPLPELDPILVGKYWAEHKERDGYTQRQIHGAVSDRPGFAVMDGLAPLRSWLVNTTGDYILQIQPDRFYFNWRKQQSGYPHFRDRDGSEGVLTKSLREFDQLGQFCEAILQKQLRPTRFELAKVDFLVSPLHWRDYSDLTSILPMLGKLPQITDEPTLNFSLVGPRDGFQVQFGLTNVILATEMAPAVKIETRVTADASPDIQATLLSMNDTANEIFFDTLDEGQLHRFGTW